MPCDDVSYPGDYAIWAFNLCAEALRTLPKAKRGLLVDAMQAETPTELPKTGRRAAIEAQKARKKDAQT